MRFALRLTWVRRTDDDRPAADIHEPTRLRARALDLADQSSRERDPFLQAQLAAEALRVWQQARAIADRGRP